MFTGEHMSSATFDKIDLATIGVPRRHLQLVQVESGICLLLLFYWQVGRVTAKSARCNNALTTNRNWQDLYIPSLP